MDERETPLIWEERGPRSALYGDIYFSLEDGLAESRAVFLQGCGLPQAWEGRRRFTVAELGFGSGLNVCALLQLWRARRPDGGRLHVFTIEAHPIGREEAQRALSAFPEIADIAQGLLAQWPGKRRGVTRIELPALDAIVDVAVMEAAQALEGWSGQAHAWFLDGFSPALNPAMWREEVIALIAARSAPGARAATFTVAGDVRRRLQANGFVVEKQPGFGRKRQRLEARLEGAPPLAARAGGGVVIGSGIAAASLARAFGALGTPVRVIADPAATAASGNPAALVTPALDAGGGPRAAFYAEAFARAVRLYETVPESVIANGAWQIEAEERDAARFEKVAAQDLFEPGSVRRAAPQEVAQALDEPAGLGGLELTGGVVVDPAAVRAAWLPAIEDGRVEAIGRDGDGWVLTLADGRRERADFIVLACGQDAARLAGLALTPVRGQASLADGIATEACAFGAYAIPTRTGVLFGATHDRGKVDVAVREEDHGRNLAALAKGRPRLAARLQSAPLQGRSGVRATTASRMPAAGEIEPGLYALTGLGSRGFCTAPLLAEHIAALVEGAPSPLRRDLAALVIPPR